MTDAQFERACNKKFGKAAWTAINYRKQTVVVDGILYACSDMTGSPRFYEIAKTIAA